MQKKDFFISYNKKDKDWAKWIAGTLEENGYSVFLQAWDIVPGNDFIERMNVFLEYSENYIAIYSENFCESKYCMKEFQTAFDAYINKEIDKFIPIRLEDVKLGSLYKTTVYIDLFDLTEEKATQKLLNGVGYTKNPRSKGEYPVRYNEKEDGANELSFPGFIRNDDINYREILILEKDKNKKGDIFNRLIFDVFHALGFDEFQYNIQKTDREVDMVLKHRTENRVALVECKAQKAPVGGDDVNKFVGVLDIERRKYECEGKQTVGYFVSKSGFKATAIEQENERSNYRGGQENNLVLLGTKDIIRELISGNMICSLEKAINAVETSKGLCLCKDVDLIACSYGWIWVLYYSKCPTQTATHFTFVHADGNPLLNKISYDILNRAEYSAYFSKLSYMETRENKVLDEKGAKNAYFKYIESELGEIQFEGMPTDKDAGAVKVQLENIFVPLGFYSKNNKRNKLSIDDVLNSGKAAILAKPGGGKSTLIRRIALAYAYPDRRKKVNDGLPDNEWFPIYIRCRDLGEEVNNGILEIVSSIVKRAEIRQHKDAFDLLIENSLQNGNVLLLIDGLDEIANEKNRISFVNQLRTFIAIYPTTRLIITSREAGFRAVANTLEGYCEQYSIAGLEEKEIRNLSLKWHQAILGESDEVKTESEKVCDIIINDDRIVSLAENPLLLTTLLFVKRWVGYLPTKKCQLYEEMIKLLLVTWNAVAHEKLDMDETEPQLAYIAYCMTLRGKQKITKDELAKYIIEARRELPELLGYTTVSPARFIIQVEERSSLLIQLGLEENEKGKLVASYEFSHLSFQEYLTAKAIAEGWVPKADELTAVDVVKEHLSEEHWKEVIPMIAVLLGRKAKVIIEFLLEECRNFEDNLVNGLVVKEEFEMNKAPFHLANCIASEVPVSMDMLDESIDFIIKGKRNIDNAVRESLNYAYTGDVYDIILKSKYGENYKSIVDNKLFDTFNENYIYEYCEAWIGTNLCVNTTVKDVMQFFVSKEQDDYIKGSLLMMHFAYRMAQRRSGDEKEVLCHIDSEELNIIFEKIWQLLKKDDELSLFAATWCIAWSGYNESDIVPDKFYNKFFERLVTLWTSGVRSKEVERTVSWALSALIKPTIKYKSDISRESLIECIEKKYVEPQNEFDTNVCISLAFLIGHWKTKEVVEKIRNSNKAICRLNDVSQFWKDISEKNMIINDEIKKLIQKTK